MQSGVTVAMLMGIVPSMAYLYIIWGKFEGIFNEKRVLFNFVLGLIIAAPLSSFYLVSRYALSSAFDLSLIFAFLFALAWCLIMFILCRRWWRREEYNALMYAVAFSVATGGTMSTFLSGYEYRNYPSPLIFLYFVPYALSIPLLLAAAGVEIAAVRDRVGPALRRGLVPSFFLLLLLCPYFWDMPVENQAMAGLVSLAVGVMYIRPIMTRIVEGLPQEVRRKWRKGRRAGC